MLEILEYTLHCGKMGEIQCFIRGFCDAKLENEMKHLVVTEIYFILFLKSFKIF